jgi:hypothetical protein
VFKHVNTEKTKDNTMDPELQLIPKTQFEYPPHAVHFRLNNAVFQAHGEPDPCHTSGTEPLPVPHGVHD